MDYIGCKRGSSANASWKEDDWGMKKAWNRHTDVQWTDVASICVQSADAQCFRSLIYLEGDCSMNKFTGKDGSAQSALSIVQRTLPLPAA